MKNRAAIFSAIATTSLLTFAMFACDDDKPSTFVDIKADAGATFTDGSFNVDGAKDPDAGTVVNCTPSLPVTFKPTFVVPVATNDCTTTQIGEYYDACLAVNGKGDVRLMDTSCSDWIAANKTCGDCIEQNEDGDPDSGTADKSGPIQIFRHRLYFGLNNGGCIAIEQGKSDDTSCAYAYDVSTQCRRDACAGCFDKSGVNFKNFTSCQDVATTGVCKTYDSPADSACVGYKDAGSSLSAVDCFPKASNEERKVFMSRVAGKFCAKQ